jgi:hypothetical protein
MKKNSSPLHGSTIAKITLARILEMPLEKYIRFMEKKTNGWHPQGGDHHRDLRLPVYGRVVVEDGRLEFQSTDERLVRQYPDDGTILPKLINTRNELSLHVVRGLLDYQRAFWESGMESDIKPLTMKQFSALFPHRRLDPSRLSRLVSTLSLQTHNRESVNLRTLFASRRMHFAHIIKEIVADSGAFLTDIEIQVVLRKEYQAALSARTICNCRKALGIPNVRERSAAYYSEHVSFGSAIALLSRQMRIIPAEAGIYELSASAQVSYPHGASQVIYIGASKNLQRRIASYGSGAIKNRRISDFAHSGKLSVRFHLTNRHLEVEKELLTAFQRHYGELPRGNARGGLQ